MNDLLYIFLTLVFLALSWGFILVCERLMKALASPWRSRSACLLRFSEGGKGGVSSVGWVSV